MLAARANRSFPSSLVPNRKWVFRAIILSLCVHLGLMIFFQHTSLKRYGDPYFERLVPRSFKVERVEIDPALLDAPDVSETPPEKKAEMARIEIPKEQESFKELLQDVRVTPVAPPKDAVKPLLEEKPPVVSGGLQEAMNKADADARLARDLDTGKIAERLVKSDVVTPGRPLLELNPSTGGNVGDTAADRVAAGFTNLDALISSGTPVENRPILMDAGLLFGYNEARLRPEAMEGLGKLAQLIARTPRAFLIIEGHTDTFGPEKYNLVLSRQRAESVRQWLVENLGLLPEHIRTVGFGETSPIVPTGTIEEQQINRRVEIVIKRRNF